MARSSEAALEEAMAAPVRDDPAPDPLQIANARAEELVKNITTQGQDQLRQLRDQCDDLMRGLQESHDDVVAEIKTHNEKVMAVLQTKVIMADAMRELISTFAPAPAARTLTLKASSGGAGK